MGQGSKFYVSLSDVNLDRFQPRNWSDLYRDPDWRVRGRYLDRVLLLLEQLPPLERDVVELYYIQGKRQETISRMLRLSQQAVSHRLATAYRRLGFLWDHPEVPPEQMRQDLTELLPGQPFAVDALCSYAETSNQTETARRLGVPQQRVCGTIQAALESLRQSAGVQSLFYVTLFGRLLQHRSILREIPKVVARDRGPCSCSRTADVGVGA